VNGTTKTRFNGEEIDLGVWKRYSMREAIVEFWPAEFGPKPAFDQLASKDAVGAAISGAIESFRQHPEHAGSLQTGGTVPKSHAFRRASDAIGEFHTALQKLKGGSPYGNAIASIFEAVAEHHLIQPTIIYDFPTAVSPLSKQKAGDPDWVERFEFYIGGFEVGNAFSELNDAQEQRLRFEQQLGERARGDDEAHAMDEDYIRALSYGLPPTAGEGIGIDRLTMILTGARSIRDVILFPLLRPHLG
jgi:lysyl-tRNA synthetase class 2